MSVIELKQSFTDEINEVGVPIRVYAETAVLKNGKKIKYSIDCALDDKGRLVTLESVGRRVCAQWWISKYGQAAIAKGMQ